jgi:hypothetical protein
MKRQERWFGIVVVIVVVAESGVSVATAAGAGVSGLEAWRAADDAAFDGAVGGGS